MVRVIDVGCRADKVLLPERPFYDVGKPVQVVGDLVRARRLGGDFESFKRSVFPRRMLAV